jgi:Interleukin-like EMT inducer
LLRLNTVYSGVPLFSVCQVDAVSWGSDDSTLYSGYIAIDGNKVINTTSSDYRGFNLVELNMMSCSPSNIRHFDTLASTTNSDNMATYINTLPLNKVLIGVTADDAQYNLTQNAKSALLAIGVDVNGLQFRGKVSFAAQIGRPSISVSHVAPPGVHNLKITMNVNGTGMLSVRTETKVCSLSADKTQDFYDF